MNRTKGDTVKLMAQYYQVVDQNKLPIEKATLNELDLQSMYPNIIKPNDVQYIFNHEETMAQQYSPHEVSIESEQGIVNYENHQVHEINVNPNSVSYMPQYILTEGKAASTSAAAYVQTEQQQNHIFYVTKPDVNELTQTLQRTEPVVLNPLLQHVQTDSRTRIVDQRKTPVYMIQPQTSQQHTHILLNRLPQQRIISQQEVPITVVQPQTTEIPQMNYNIESSQTILNNVHNVENVVERKIVTLQDGTTMDASAYKRLLEQRALVQEHKKQQSRKLTHNQQQQTVVQQRVNQMPDNYMSPLIKKPGQRKYSPMNRNRGGGSGSRGAVRGGIPNLPVPPLDNPDNARITAAQQQQPQQQQQQQQEQQHPRIVIGRFPQHNPCVVPQPLPPCLHSDQIRRVIESSLEGEQYEDCKRMLVALANGEQRLITFTLPREPCTIQEILEQVGVPFYPHTNIEYDEMNRPDINYYVRVGSPRHFTHQRSDTEESLQSQSSSVSNNSSTSVVDVASTTSDAEPQQPVKSECTSAIPLPEPPKEVPRYVPGRFAVCKHCGFNSDDFNKCQRCGTKFPDEPKSVLKDPPVYAGNVATKTLENALSGKTDKRLLVKSNGLKTVPKPRTKPRPRQLHDIDVIVTLSSDDENTDGDAKGATELLRRFSSDSSVTLQPIDKEPTVTDIQRSCLDTADSVGTNNHGMQQNDSGSYYETSIKCRTVRLGSYKFIPTEHVLISSNCIKIVAPIVPLSNKYESVVIPKANILKILINFQKAVPSIFFFTTPNQASSIRNQLRMEEGTPFYYDPLSKEEQYRRITILPESISDTSREIIRQIFRHPNPILDELSTKEANNILVKIYPKEMQQAPKSTYVSSSLEVQQLIIYPPGTGGISINTEDFLCLGQDQFLNDVIIDFYLKYLFNSLPKVSQDRVHIFSNFFYKRLTTKPLKTSRKSHPTEWDTSLTPAQKRHARIKNWTKNVNIFDKDFVVIPINERSHWFLAVICFPGLDGCYSMRDNTKVVLKPHERKKKPLIVAATIGNTTITAVKQETAEDSTIPCDDAESSDRDEAEGDESELESDSDSVIDDETPPKEIVTAVPNAPTKSNVQARQPIKQPCILIMDSLHGASRSRVVATLREYLTCEYLAKTGNVKIFTKDVIKGACPKVPQQTNFTDCGLYLLQYAEQFFKDPIKDFHIPIKEIKNWFEEIVVTSKRESISSLIRDLMNQYDKDCSILPDITFPTLNGKLIESPKEEKESDPSQTSTNNDEQEARQDDAQEVCKEYSVASEVIIQSQTTVERVEPSELMDEEVPHPRVDQNLPLIKPSCTSVGHKDGKFLTTPSDVKPDFSEQKKIETMMYLKNKRINKHNLKTDPSENDVKRLKKTK